MLCKALAAILSAVLSLMPFSAGALTLDEALEMARETLPAYKASELRVRSTEALYSASLSPYLPSLDAAASHRRHFTSLGEYNTRFYDLTLSYTLFDWGNRKAGRNIAGLNLDITREDLRTSLLDIEFNVKSAFYTAIARKEALEYRRIQLNDAEKDFEVAEGRYKFGVARLSDVLQSSVRLEQARFALVEAEGDFRKAILELNSLIGRPLESRYDIQGILEIEVEFPDRNSLADAVLRRPEVKQAEDVIKIEQNTKAAAFSAFFPVLATHAAYQKSGTGRTGTTFGQSAPDEDKILGLTATWNIFELGKFFRVKSSGLEAEAAQERLNDLKRQLVLDVNNAYEDLVTASRNLRVAEEQIRQAEQNYSQAFGEYKVGKADILSLVQAESLLAVAREQFVDTKLNLMISKSQLERIAGVGKLERLNGQKTEKP
jgi:outer membrane protein